MGLTVGVGSVGAAMGGRVLAAPGQELPDENPLELHEKQQQFEMLYANERTPAEEMERAALEAPTVEQTHYEHPRYRPGSDVDCLIPEIWAREGLAILEESMVIGALVHRDFSDQVAQYGDVVNCRVPQPFKLVRKTDADLIDFNERDIVMRATPLDQHFYSAFNIRDHEHSLSFHDIVNIHIAPAMACMARGIDLQVYETFAKSKSKMICHGGLRPDKETGKRSVGPDIPETVLQMRQAMNENKAFMEGRNLVVSPEVETEILRSDLFVMDRKERHMTRLEQNRLGQLFGYDVYMDQSVRGGIAFHRDGVGMINRPLMLPPGHCGVRSAVAVHNDMALRCTMSYNMMKQGTDVTFDMLTGFTTLDENLIVRTAESGIYPGYSYLDEDLKCVMLG